MKQFRTLLLALCLVLVLAFTAQAAEGAMAVSAVSGPGNATVTVSLQAGDWENNGEICLTYPETLTLASAGTGLDGPLTVLDTDTAGKVSLYWAGESGKAAASELLTAVFTGEPGEYALTLQVPELGDSLDVETQELTITIGDPCMNGHSYVLTERVEPTETEDGYEVYTCSVCGDSYITQLPALGCPSLQFTDVNTGAWYHEAVDYVLNNGLMIGVSDTRFSPNGKTTRGQLVTILYRMEGSPAVTGGSPFTDVAEGQYYANAVSWAAENGIVNGVTETLFLPNREITREQAATILYRYAGYKGVDLTAGGSLDGFPDAGSVSEYARPAMAWAVDTGLIVGIDGRLAPRGNATRAQVATLIMRFQADILN